MADVVAVQCVYSSVDSKLDFAQLNKLHQTKSGRAI